MASTKLNINIAGKFGLKEFVLTLIFDYSTETSLQYEYSFYGNDYGLRLTAPENKDIYFENDNLIVMPAVMRFNVLDLNGRLTDLIYEGKIFDPDALVLPADYRVPLKNKKIYGIYKQGSDVIIEGYLSFDPSESDTKTRMISFAIAPRTDILKEKKISDLPADPSLISIKDAIAKILQKIDSSITAENVRLINDWVFRGETEEHCSNALADFNIEQLQLVWSEFFAADMSLYEALTGLCFTFFSQLIIDGKNIIFKRQDAALSYPATIQLKTNRNLQNIIKELRYKPLDYIKINFRDTQQVGGQSSFIMGDPNGTNVFEHEIRWGIYHANFYNCGNNTMRRKLSSNIIGITGSTKFYILYIVIPSETERYWSVILAGKWFNYKNASENGVLYNLKVIAEDISFYKNYATVNRLGQITALYSPVGMSIDTVIGQGEIKCIKVEEFDYDLYPVYPLLDGGLFTLDGYRLFTNNERAIFAKKEEDS